MRRRAVTALIVVLAPHVAAAHVVRHSSIPQAYWGTWTAGAGTCGDAKKAAIVLSAKAYVSPMASCTVDYVSETAGAQGPIYSARLQCSDATGGTQRKSVANLIIRPDSVDRISVGSNFDSLTAYERCSPSVPGTKH